MTQPDPRPQYAGPATIAAEDVRIEVEADLRGRFEPIDGRFHWYGRLAATGASRGPRPRSATREVRATRRDTEKTSHPASAPWSVRMTGERGLAHLGARIALVEERVHELV